MARRRSDAISMERSRRRGNGSARRHGRSRGRWVGLLLMGVGVVCALLLMLRQMEYRQTRAEYAQVAALAEATAAPPPETPLPLVAAQQGEEATSSPVLFIPTSLPAATPAPYQSEKVAKLRKQNSDAVAWIEIADTGIAYPVVQGKDNEYYETHTFQKKRRDGGGIFLDAWNATDGSDFNTVIYGHNMKDGSMFSELREYRHDAFLREHKYIDLEFSGSRKRYKVFSAYVCDEGVDFRGLSCATEAEKTSFLCGIEHRTEIHTNAEAKATDSLLTLVTCTSGERDRYWIVHAVLVEEITTQK